MFPGLGGSALLPGFYFMYNIWQDAGIQTRVAATAARCATHELQTFPAQSQTPRSIGQPKVQLAPVLVSAKSDSLQYWTDLVEVRLPAVLDVEQSHFQKYLPGLTLTPCSVSHSAVLLSTVLISA